MVPGPKIKYFYKLLIILSPPTKFGKIEESFELPKNGDKDDGDDDVFNLGAASGKSPRINLRAGCKFTGQLRGC
jgi:hypothetical protein